jgi:hypothetical protein
VAINHRRLSGLAVALGGSLFALLFGGGTVAMCLGPLGVTAVRCAAHSGLAPTEGPWIGMIVSAIALGILVAIGRTGFGWREALAGLGGAVLGGVAYLVRRPLTLEGPDYDGTWLVIPLPVVQSTLLFWSLAGSLVGLAVLALWRATRNRGTTG